MYFLARNGLARVLALLASIAILLVLGVFGMGHGGLSETNIDTGFLYLAGKYWWAGIDAFAPNAPLPGPADPRLAVAMQDYNFAYPPQSAPLCLLLAVGTLDQAYAIMDGLNLLAVAALAYFCVRLAEDGVTAGGEGGTHTTHRWFVSAFVIGNLSTAFVVWMGQTSLIVTAALAGAWYFSRHDRWVLAGILLAVATIKPPLSMFVVLWFLLERQGKTLLVMAATILVFAVVPMLVRGPILVFFVWLASIGNYGAHPHNALGSRMLFNLRSLLHAGGVTTPDLTAFGFVATFALWYRRRAFAESDLIGVLVGIALLFGSSHSYDLAALVLLIPAFWRHLHTRPVAALAAITALVVISFPNSLLVRFGSDVLLHARVAVVSGMLVWLLALSAQAGGAAGVRCFPSTSRIP